MTWDDDDKASRLRFAKQVFCGFLRCFFGSTSRPRQYLWQHVSALAQADAMRRELAMFHEVILDIDESPGRLTKRGEPLVASAHVDRAAVYGDSLAADSLYRSRSPVVSGGIRWSWDTFWWAGEYSHWGTCRGAPRDAMKCHKRLPTCSIQSVGTITSLTSLMKKIHQISHPNFHSISHQQKGGHRSIQKSLLRSPPSPPADDLAQVRLLGPG